MTTRLNRWQDLVNAVLGVWLLASPWVIGVDDGSPAMWNAVITGVLLSGLALGAFFVPRVWEEWAQGAIGAWLIVSPWALAFSTRENLMLNALWVGVAVLALALWNLLANKEQHGTASQTGRATVAH